MLSTTRIGFSQMKYTCGVSSRDRSRCQTGLVSWSYFRTSVLPSGSRTSAIRRGVSPSSRTFESSCFLDARLTKISPPPASVRARAVSTSWIQDSNCSSVTGMGSAGAGRGRSKLRLIDHGLHVRARGGAVDLEEIVRADIGEILEGSESGGEPPAQDFPRNFPDHADVGDEDLFEIALVVIEPGFRNHPDAVDQALDVGGGVRAEFFYFFENAVVQKRREPGVAHLVELGRLLGIELEHERQFHDEDLARKYRVLQRLRLLRDHLRLTALDLLRDALHPLIV